MNQVTKKLVYTCNCTANHLSNANQKVTLNNYAVNTTSCSCVNFGDRTTCDCCVSNSTISILRPSCSADTSSERCACRNNTVQVPKQRTVFFNVTRPVNLTCRRTGFNGHLCQMEADRTVIPWNNSHACYSTVAGTTCDFQTSTNTCGWTITPALTACLARPAVIRTPQIYQNLTFTGATAPRLVNITETRSRNETFFEAQNLFQCNCSNSRYPSLPLVNAPSAAPGVCGCDARAANGSQTCDCCLNRKSVDDLFLSTISCRANQTQSACTCDSNNLCSCSIPNSNSFYKDLKVDAKSCNCITRNGTSLKDCNCCIASQAAALIPAAPVCSSIQTSLNGCICDSFSNSSLKCACRNGFLNRTEFFNATINSTVTNSTTNTTTVIQVPRTFNRTVTDIAWVNQTLDSAQCGCLNTATFTNPSKVSSICNCCTFRAFQCNALTTADQQNCDCRNATVINGRIRSWQWSCSCLRRDTNVRRDFNFTNTNDCGYNPSIGAFQCCLTRSFMDT